MSVFRDLMKVYEILKAIEKEPGITTNKLYQKVGISKPRLIQILNELRGKGLVSRVNVDEDLPYFYRKPLKHYLTPKGKAFLTKLEDLIRLI